MKNSFGSVTANLFARIYLRNLSKELERVNYPDSKAAMGRVRLEAQKLFDARPKTTPDSLAPLFFGGISALVLATYREVLSQTGDSKLAFAMARNSGHNVFGIPTRLAMRVPLWLVNDPIRLLSGKSLLKFLWVRRHWSLVFSEKITAERAIVFIHHCPYHQFFTDHGAPQLTTILCEWDRLWLDVIDKSPRPIRTERFSTISTGSQRCEFRLIRDHIRSIQQTRDVVTGWQPIEFSSQKRSSHS